uniref:uncharacterized protein n=1 Tax=Myxine glutinosa TaxID=7769 RepID=UPI00358E4BE9
MRLHKSTGLTWGLLTLLGLALGATTSKGDPSMCSWFSTIHRKRVSNLPVAVVGGIQTLPPSYCFWKMLRMVAYSKTPSARNECAMAGRRPPRSVGPSLAVIRTFWDSESPNAPRPPPYESHQPKEDKSMTYFHLSDLGFTELTPLREGYGSDSIIWGPTATAEYPTASHGSLTANPLDTTGPFPADNPEMVSQDDETEGNRPSINPTTPLPPSPVLPDWRHRTDLNANDSNKAVGLTARQVTTIASICSISFVVIAAAVVLRTSWVRSRNHLRRSLQRRDGGGIEETCPVTLSSSPSSRKPPAVPPIFTTYSDIGVAMLSPPQPSQPPSCVLSSPVIITTASDIAPRLYDGRRIPLYTVSATTTVASVDPTLTSASFPQLLPGSLHGPSIAKTAYNGSRFVARTRGGRGAALGGASATATTPARVFRARAEVHCDPELT